MKNRIKLSISAAGFEAFRGMLRIFLRGYNYDSVPEAFNFEVMYGVYMRMQQTTTIKRNSIIINVNMAEAVLLWRLCNGLQEAGAIEYATSLDILRQIEHNAGRYIAEMNELKNRVL